MNNRLYFQNLCVARKSGILNPRCLLIKFLTALFLMSFGIAEALPPVVLTNDQKTKLDLTSDEAKSVNLLDCQLRVEGQSPNFRLVHSKGVLSIPLLAVKTIQDGSSVVVAIKGTLAGLPVSQIRLSYLKQPTNSFADMPLQHSDNNGLVFPQNSNFFLISEDEIKVAFVLKQKFGERSIRLFDDRVIVFHTKPEIESVGGYGFEPWFKFHHATQVEYECIF